MARGSKGSTPKVRPLPWQQQEGEGGEAYQAFICYRELGYSRTFSAVERELQKSYTLIHRWSGVWTWRVRVTEWDLFQEKEQEKENRKARREMAKRHAGIASKLLEKVKDRIETMLAKEIKPSQIGHLMTAAAAMERLALGEPTSVTELRQSQRAGAILERLTDDELELVERVMEEAAGRDVEEP